VSEEATQATRIEVVGDSNGLDVFIQAYPVSTSSDEREQFISMASRANEALLTKGMGPNNIVSGFIHLAKAPSWSWREALATAWGVNDPFPITVLLHPPTVPLCFSTIQLHAIRTPRQSGVWYGHTAKLTAATILRAGARHLRLMSILPCAELASTASFSDLAYDMLAQAGHALTARGLSFKDVVRTWIHLRDIEHDYEALNQARNRFFSEQELVRLPASTCVEGSLPDTVSPVAMDLLAVAVSQDVDVEAMSPGTMGDATVYGSSFARGTQLIEPGRRTLFISGTASIDAQGNVVAVGEIQGQLDCMFRNVRALLTEAGMDLGDTVCATTYLKRPEFRGAYSKAAAAHGLAVDVPTAVVVANICRPEWLCEIELCAMRLKG
jgi:enamine deaminase RidA (YjgF/YER057c/UK114 family)